MWLIEQSSSGSFLWQNLFIVDKMIRKAPGNFFEFAIGFSLPWISLQEEIIQTDAVAVGQIWS